MIMSQVKQCITHQCYLSRYFSDLTKESVSHFSLEFILLAPAYLISTDIQTGFPYLQVSYRQALDQFIKKQLRLYIDKHPYQEKEELPYIADFLKELNARLDLYFSSQNELDFDSYALNLSLQLNR